MESVDLDMGEIFDDQDDVDDDVGNVGPLPDLPEASQEGNEDEENVEVLARLKDLSKGAAKKVVRKPQPKLDPTRLTGERGIPILPRMFEKMKFKGKGHEAQDLATIMRQMEHWGHRLFPKMPFDEVIERVEKLGAKGEVKTCVRKVRLDMPLLNDDFVGSDREDDEEALPQEGGDNQRAANAEDMWEELLMEEAEIQASQIGKTQQGVEPLPEATPSVVERPAPVTPKPQSDSPAAFTPEQLARIERNKQLAREKRMKKLGIQTPVKTPEIKLSTSDLLEPTQSQNDSVKMISQDDGTPQEPVRPESSVSVGDAVAMETEDGMSEVIPQGPSQNIVVENKHPDDAQKWGSDTGEMSVDTENDGANSGTIHNEDSEASAKESLHYHRDSKSSNDDNPLAERTAQENMKVNSNSCTLLKDVSAEKDGNGLAGKATLEQLGKCDTDSNDLSEVIAVQGDRSITVNGEEDKENALVGDKVKAVKMVEVQPDMIGDHQANGEGFDEELTEEQLMETVS